MQFRTPPQNMIPQEACSEIPCHRHPRGVWVKSKLPWKIGKNLENPWGAKLIADEDRSSRRCPFVGSNFHCHVMFSSVRSVEDKMIDDGGCRPASLKIYGLVHNHLSDHEWTGGFSLALKSSRSIRHKFHVRVAPRRIIWTTRSLV